eukprot:scaffold101576_cov30-Tisochrysis_lutea.AAC.2
MPTATPEMMKARLVNVVYRVSKPRLRNRWETMGDGRYDQVKNKGDGIATTWKQARREWRSDWNMARPRLGRKDGLARL